MPRRGKTPLVIRLAIAVAQSGRRVYYGTLADLITSRGQPGRAPQPAPEDAGLPVAPGGR
jgi:hypothetical protein